LKSRLLIVARSVVPFILTLLLLWLISHAVNFHEVLRQLLAIHLGFFAIAVVLMLLSTAIATLRYQSVLHALCPEGQVPFVPLLRLNLLTLFSAHFLPFGALADAMRVLISRNLLKMPVGMAAEGVVADRALATAGFALFGLLFLPLQIGGQWPWPLITAQAATFGGLLLLLAVVVLGFADGSGFLEPVAKAVRRFIGHIAKRSDLSWQLCLAAVGIGSFAAMLMLLGLGLGLHIPLWIAFAVTPAIYLSQVVPIFYAGFGSRGRTRRSPCAQRRSGQP
jgi:uncharacterized membrane protein YbhN (UPF0104 family)